MSKPIYRVKDWNEHFENNRTKEMVQMRWVPVPNKHDGDGYTELMERPNGIALYGAWHLILQVASKCKTRGLLIRDNNEPHTAASIKRITSGDLETIQLALIACVEIGWLEIVDVSGNVINGLQNPAPSCGNPAPSCAEPPTASAGIPHPTDEGREGKGKEGKSSAGAVPPPKAPKPKSETAWGIWIDANRDAGRADPVQAGPDLAASRNFFGALKQDVSKFRAVCEMYLKDRTKFLVDTGHALRHMAINKYINKPILVQGSRAIPDDEDAFELEAQKHGKKENDEPGVTIPI